MKETPFIAMLRAYGVDPMTVPEDATVTLIHDQDGIFVETFCYDQNDEVAIDDLNSNIVTRDVYYPHP